MKDVKKKKSVQTYSLLQHMSLVVLDSSSVKTDVAYRVVGSVTKKMIAEMVVMKKIARCHHLSLVEVS
jgi:hypothetical protein